jgi:ATP-binding cassette subfamily B protein
MTADFSFVAEPRTDAPQAPRLPRSPLGFVLYFVRLRPWWYLGMFLSETVVSCSSILLPYAISEILRTATKPHNVSLFEAIATPFYLFGALSISEVIFSRLAGLLQFWLGPVQRQDATRALYHYLQYHSHRYFSNNFAGALAHRIGEAAMGVNQLLWAILFDFWPVAIVLSVSTILLARANTGLAVFVGVWALVFVGASFWLAKRCRPHAVKAAAARSETTGKLVDTVTNHASVRLFSRLGFERDYLDGYMAHELEAMRTSMWYAERVRWFQWISAATLKIGTLGYTLRLWNEGLIGAPEFVLATGLALLIINEARNLSRRFLEFFEFIGNVSNGVNTILVGHELVDRDNAIAPAISRGEIEFDRVGFAYAEDQKKIFDDLSVRILAGQRVGLVGLSGSGKSTFVNLILRMYEPQSGQIRIDGHDLASVTQDALHEQIGLIPQEPSLFHRSLRDNIRFGRLDASDAEVEHAAARARAHEFIAHMREGYDAMVGERGVKLSGGQRQRIAIARVILKNAPILILDEATASLDSITERAIQETLDDAMGGKTVIVVAHRLSTIAHLDRILVFDQGCIVEDGSHAQLLARCGTYHRLWQKQIDGFLPDSVGPGPVRSNGTSSAQSAEANLRRHSEWDALSTETV